MNNEYINHTHSYLALRKAVGWIGIILPFALMLGVKIIFKEDVFQSSISHYYHTGMSGVFVGALCAVALFMFFYSGYNKQDDWAGNIAGFFALGVAWFPTTEHNPIDSIGIIHLICAACFFITLSVFSIFLFRKRGDIVTPQKRIRNIIYLVCGIIMLLCLASIVIYFKFFETPNDNIHLVFWAETVALLAFGFSWLVKGEQLFEDK
ncbi:MAG: hypothetical protein OEX22_11970 [Cyclobacteriaceae bacterium]|nr:hypothetical protein [Cyclobacteriaceae bacterium]